MSRENARFIIDNYSDEVTLTVSPSVPVTMPASNLQLASRAMIMRSANLTNQDVYGTFNSLRVIGGCVLYNHTLTSSALWRLRLYNLDDQESTTEATNLLLRSEELDHATWVKTAATVVADAGASPDATTHADSVELTSGSGSIYQSVTVAASTEYTFSFYVKYSGSGVIALRIYNNTGASQIVLANYNSQITSLGYNRVSVTFTTPVGCTSIRCYPLYYNGDLLTAFIWGTQLELGATATSYIPTTSATVTAFVPSYDSWWTLANPPKSLGELDWGIDPLGASIFTGWGKVFSQMWFDAKRGRSFTLTVRDPGNPDGYWDASRLVMGPAVSPVYNIMYGIDLKWADNSTQSRTGGGSLRTDLAAEGSYRTVTFNMDRLESGDRAKFTDIQRKIGLRKDFFVSLCPGVGGAEERDYAMMAKNVQLGQIKYVDFVVNGDMQYTIEET